MRTFSLASGPELNSLVRRFVVCLVVPLVAFASVSSLAVYCAEVRLSRDFSKVEFKDMPREGGSCWRIEHVAYPALDAAEWQVRLQAPTRSESPMFDNVASADFILRLPADAVPMLHWNKGSQNEASDFQPFEATLATGEVKKLESFGGRSSDGVLPYFNIACAGGGLIVAVGWSGDWKAGFEYLGRGEVRVSAGMKRSHFVLGPGEVVRLPSLLAMGYKGDWLDGQNRFRRLMLKEFTPKDHAPMELMPVGASVHGMIGFNDTTESNLVALAADIGRSKLAVDTFWLDAGWNLGGFPLGQGNPDADPARFPGGLAPVGAAAGKAGLRFLAWFEPERVMRGTWMESQHASWLFHPSGTPPHLRYHEKDGFRLLDLGNAEARRWVTDAISTRIRAANIAVYRQDFNLYPGYFWATDEAPDRVGLREAGHIAGLYEFLDALRRRNPGLIVDNCASGGRRLDFEMMRRSVALWRSDSCWGDSHYPRNAQAMTYGLSLWLPLHGLGAAATDDAALRSGMGSCASFAVNYRDSASVEALRKHLGRYLRIRPRFSKDFHPLTAWTDDPGQCLAFQFHDPGSGAGVVQVFPGTNAAANPVALRLRGLDRKGRVKVLDWDGAGEGTMMDASELMDRGLPLTGHPGAAPLVFEYGSVGRSAATGLSR